MLGLICKHLLFGITRQVYLFCALQLSWKCTIMLENGLQHSSRCIHCIGKMCWCRIAKNWSSAVTLVFIYKWSSIRSPPIIRSLQKIYISQCCNYFHHSINKLCNSSVSDEAFCSDGIAGDRGNKGQGSAKKTRSKSSSFITQRLCVFLVEMQHLD